MKRSLANHQAVSSTKQEKLLIYEALKYTIFINFVAYRDKLFFLKMLCHNTDLDKSCSIMILDQTLSALAGVSIRLKVAFAYSFKEFTLNE